MPTMNFEDIAARSALYPKTVSQWLSYSHPRKSYNARPLGFRDPYITRFLTYYFVYSKILLPPRMTQGLSPITLDYNRDLTTPQFWNEVQSNPAYRGYYRTDGSWVPINAARQNPFGDLVGMIEEGYRGTKRGIRFARELFDDPVQATEDLINEASDYLEEQILDGTAARRVGSMVGPLCLPCGAVLGSVALAQMIAHDNDWFGYRGANVLPHVDFTRQQQRGRRFSKRERFFKWPLQNNPAVSSRGKFDYSLFTHNPFEAQELEYQNRLGFALQGLFSENIIGTTSARDSNFIAYTAFAIKDILESGEHENLVDVIRLFHAIRLLPRYNELRNRADPLKVKRTKDGIPFVRLQKSKVVVELPQIEALLLIMQQNPQVLGLFSLVLDQEPFNSLASWAVPQMGNLRTKFRNLNETSSVRVSQSRPAVQFTPPQPKPQPEPQPIVQTPNYAVEPTLSKPEKIAIGSAAALGMVSLGVLAFKRFYR